MSLSHLPRRESGADQEHERTMVCTRCKEPILVCMHVKDLDPKTYVGWACGCRRPRVPWEQLFEAPRGVKTA